MKNITKKILAAGILIAAISHAVIGQTNVSGGIYSNTTWTLANSPYIVTGNIVLFPGKTLTIEPGVKVKFDSGTNLEIRGNLMAIGTITDSISFISNTSLIKGAWNNISILNATQNAAGWFKYCIVKHSTYGIEVECCWGNDSTYIKNSWFDNNTTASSSYAGWNMSIDNCLFTNNTTAVTQADKKMTNCTFINNVTGIQCERFEARNCLFHDNTTAIDGNGTTDSCTIINNNIGITGAGTITNNTVSNNIIGIVSDQSSWRQDSIDYYVTIINNHICYNSQYNIKNDNAYNKNITQNCFCTSDSTTIETKLYDGYDNIAMGLFNYDIYDSTCQNVIQSVYKIGIPPITTTAKYAISEKLNISIAPNPFTSNAILSFSQEQKKTTIKLIDMLGKEMRNINFKGRQLIIEKEEMQAGIYFVQITDADKNVVNKKIVIQ